MADFDFNCQCFLISFITLTWGERIFRLIYMTNNDRNMRTLIVCFVLLMLALIPLRFSEYHQMMNSKVQVLGEQTTGQEIILPNAEIR